MHKLLRNTIVGAAAMAVATGAYVGMTHDTAQAASYELSDYGTYPGNADGRNSDNGWGNKKYPDTCPTEADLGWATTSNGVKMQVRTELVGLTKLLLDRTQEMGYAIRPDDISSFSCRGTRGPGTDPSFPSNHSRGRAIDINISTNPFTTESEGLQSDIPPEVVKLWETHGWYWGGRFLDAMHFEFAGTPEDAKRYEAQLSGSGSTPKPSTSASPSSRPTSTSTATSRPSSSSSSRPMLRQGSQGQDVRTLQQKLTSLGYDPQGVDGVFGPNTESAVRRFQAAKGLEVDGIVGPRTWAALG